MVGTCATRDNVRRQVPGRWTGRLARVVERHGPGRTLAANTMLSAVLVLSGVVAEAAVERVQGKAVRTLTTGDGRFGGCMAQLNKRLSDAGLNCPGNWVTFSCTGVHASKEDGSRMFESAQMAFSLDKTIVVEVDDEKKHNGHCYARRVDVKKN